MISLAGKKRTLPIYWKILTHKGATNLTKQKAVIRPIIRLLKGQKIILTADREFYFWRSLIYNKAKTQNLKFT